MADAPADVVPINFVCDAMLHILHAKAVARTQDGTGIVCLIDLFKGDRHPPCALRQDLLDTLEAIGRHELSEVITQRPPQVQIVGYRFLLCRAKRGRVDFVHPYPTTAAPSVALQTYSWGSCPLRVG